MFKVFIKVVTNSKKEAIVKNPDGSFKIWIKEKPIKGKANESVIKLLSKYYKTAKSDIQIISGETSNKKIISIDM
jgi:hypothetical protein